MSDCKCNPEPPVVEFKKDPVHTWRTHIPGHTCVLNWETPPSWRFRWGTRIFLGMKWEKLT